MVKITAFRPEDAPVDADPQHGMSKGPYCKATQESFFSIPIHVKTAAVTLCKNGKPTGHEWTFADDAAAA